MSILDFTTGLFREPANLRSFVDNPGQALKDAGLPDATPDQVHDLLPLVAESMPPDHPLQTVVHSADPVRALAELDIDELVADVHHRHHETQFIEKTLGQAECRPGDEDDDDDGPAETIDAGHWDLVDEDDKTAALATCWHRRSKKVTRSQSTTIPKTWRRRTNRARTTRSRRALSTRFKLDLRPLPKWKGSLERWGVARDEH